MIKGFTRTSFVDWPGHIAAVIFTGGCNFKCGYCQNKVLLDDSLPDYPLVEILDHLKAKRNWLTGVVISGGEPTIHGKKLWDLIARIYALGYPIKLDTNGARYADIECLIRSGLVRAIHMDVKAPLTREYGEVVGTHEPLDNVLYAVNEAVKYLRSWDGEVLFRTTRLPWMTDDGIASIKEWVGNAHPHIVQEYREPRGEQ